jgi:hypothetical protein
MNGHDSVGYAFFASELTRPFLRSWIEAKRDAKISSLALAYLWLAQGCQIFHGTTYQNRRNIPKYTTLQKYTKWQ